MAGDGMRRKRPPLLIGVIGALLLLAAGGRYVWGMLPARDPLCPDGLPQEYYIASGHNYIDYQTGNECAAYAAAYVMRHLGAQITGPELYPELHRVFGFVSVRQVAGLLERHGYHAAAYYGTLDTLKGRLAEGVPVIAFIRIPGDTHYTVVTGYDGQFLYLADSIAALANAEGGWYNRRLRAEEFEDLWSTDRYPMEFVYLAVTP